MPESNLYRVIFTNVRPRCANVRSGVRTFVRTNVRSTNVRPGDRTFVPGVGHRACGFEPGMLASNVRTRGTNARPTNVRSRARCERSSVERSLRIDERSPPRNERSSPVSERSSILRTFAHIHSDFRPHTVARAHFEPRVTNLEVAVQAPRRRNGRARATGSKLQTGRARSGQVRKGAHRGHQHDHFQSGDLARFGIDTARSTSRDKKFRAARAFREEWGRETGHSEFLTTPRWRAAPAGRLCPLG